MTLRIREPVSYYKSFYRWGVPHLFGFEQWMSNDLQANTLISSHNSIASQRNETLPRLTDERCAELINWTKHFTLMYTTKHFNEGLVYLKNLTGLALPRKKIAIQRKWWINTNKSFEFPSDETIYRLTHERAPCDWKLYNLAKHREQNIL